MARKQTKARLVEDMCMSIGLPQAQMEKLPEILTDLVRRATTPPCVVTFAFSPGTGQLLQISVSEFLKTPQAYAMLADTTMTVAQQFQRQMREVLNAENPTGMGPDAGAPGDVESGNGRGTNGREVVEEVPVVSSGD